MPYQDMTDRELMIRLYARLDNLCEDVQELKETLKNRPCPSELCATHGEDIAMLKYRNQLLAWSFGAVSTILAIAIAAIALVVS